MSSPSKLTELIFIIETILPKELFRYETHFAPLNSYIGGGSIGKVKKDVLHLYMNEIEIIFIPMTDIIYVLPGNYKSYHLQRIIINNLSIPYVEFINVVQTINFVDIYRYIEILNIMLTINIYDMCTICGHPHDKPGLTYIETCHKKTCHKKIYHYPKNEELTTMLTTDIETLQFLVLTMCAGLVHFTAETFIKELPVFFDAVKDDMSIVDICKKIPKCFDDQVSFYKWYDSVKVREETEYTGISDKTLLHYLIIGGHCDYIYVFLINAISNNYHSLSSYKHLIKSETMETYDLINAENIQFFNINYPEKTESLINSQIISEDCGLQYLFHGSNYSCWHSIIKNGLINMSGTKFMTAGAAYGNGIYASNNIKISIGYAKGPISVIGVFQLVKNKETYVKAPGIYVINDEKIMYLRTLICIEKPIKNATTYNILNSHFIISKSLKTDRRLIDKLMAKRLNAELKIISRYPTKYTIININVDETIVDKDFLNFGNEWTIQLLCTGTPVIKIYFTDYPNIAPTVKLHEYVGVIHGIITPDRGIKLDILTQRTWNITIKLINIFDEIMNFFND